MTLDNYPFWKDLVSEIKGPNSTDGWDILVSYEMSHLNDFLNRTWDSKNNSDQPLEQFEVKRYEKHHHVDCLHSIATWNVTLKPPTLQFAFDHAVLRMAVSGTVSIQYYTGDAGHETKDGDPETGPISDGWTMIVTTSMSSVTVTEGGDIQDRRAQGTIIDFSSDPSHKGQIVFDCGLSDDFTVTFKWTGKNDPKESVPEDNLEQARRWIKNHVKAIDFSLASIAKDQDPSSSFLTPEKMTFQLYHPLKEDPDAWTQVGCLSVYIKTRQTGEGQGVGHEVPSFSGGRMYPVAGGYSASIILSSWYYQWYETNIDVDLRHGILNMVWYGFHLEGDWIPDYQDRSSYADDFLMLAQLPWD